MFISSFRQKKIFVIIGILILAIAIFGYMRFFAAPGGNAERQEFVVVPGGEKSQVIANLKTKGFIKSITGFEFAERMTGGGTIRSGGYFISKSMNVFGIARVLKDDPAMKWVTIPEGLRKEEIAVILAKTLGWNEQDTMQWIQVDTAKNPDYIEGVYFPDTYLIPIDESGAQIAERLRSRFEEKFALYAEDAIAQNIKWTTALKVASLIQREAAGKDDMGIISGVIWNRLTQGMKLDIDASLQYARGDTGSGWWAPATSADKKIDSPYNTYTHAGLPPHPIGNPGALAIQAAIHPAKTDCLYYLHDAQGDIHCSKTYEAHLNNIQKYLK